MNEVVKYPHGIRTVLYNSSNFESFSHGHDACEFIYVRRGTLDITVQGKNMKLACGNLVFLKGGEQHSVKTNIDSEMLIMLFDPNLVNWLPFAARLKSYILNHNYDFEEFYAAVQTELERKDIYYETVIKNKISEFLIRLYRGEEHIGLSVKGCVKEKKSTLAGLIAQIDSFYASYTNEDGAKYMHMCRTHFSRYFHQKTGIIFSEYLNIVKVGKAVEMINNQTDVKTKELATLCGFSTERNFTRVFKKYTNLTPKHLPNGYIFNQNKLLEEKSSINNQRFIKVHHMQSYKANSSLQT